MTEKQALKLAQAKWGKRAHVRASRFPSSADARERASARLKVHRATEPKLPPLSEWPADATIGEYRAAIAHHNVAFRAWRDERDRLTGDALHYCFRVGKIESILGGAFNVLGQGDTWEEALQKAGIEIPQRKAARA
jgi:hypothetical protein